jgi:hypothetical protein
MDLLVKPSVPQSEQLESKNDKSDPSWVPMSHETSWSKLLLPPREYNDHDQYDDSLWIDSIKVVKFLCSDIEENKNWIRDNRKEILLESLRILEEDSQGSFR